jgi:hypothetical protein
LASRNSSCIPRHGPEQDTYLVLDDFGPRYGRAWRETDADAADRETLISNLLSGEYSKPVRIIAFNSVEGWCRDVTADVADEVRRRVVEQDRISEALLAFLDANRG